MSVSKKTRFEVFKRDGFRCAYCGKTPPEITLEIDHIEPRSRGGKDDVNNLLTACFSCNRGKTNIPLDKAPQTLSDNLEVLKERESQLKEYRKLVKKIDRRVQADIIALRNAVGRRLNKDKVIPYFCGICWHKIKGTERYGKR